MSHLRALKRLRFPSSSSSCDDSISSCGSDRSEAIAPGHPFGGASKFRVHDTRKCNRISVSSSSSPAKKKKQQPRTLKKQSEPRQRHQDPHQQHQQQHWTPYADEDDLASSRFFDEEDGEQQSDRLNESRFSSPEEDDVISQEGDDNDGYDQNSDSRSYTSSTNSFFGGSGSGSGTGEQNSSYNSENGSDCQCENDFDDGDATGGLNLIGPSMRQRLRFRTDLGTDSYGRALSKRHAHLGTEVEQKKFQQTLRAANLAEWIAAQTKPSDTEWTKPQQALSLCYLVVEAHQYQVRQTRMKSAAKKASTSNGSQVPLQPHPPLVDPLSPSPATRFDQRASSSPAGPARTPSPTSAAGRQLDFTNPSTTARLLSDIIILVAHADEGISRYERVRQQLIALAFWGEDQHSVPSSAATNE